MGPLRGQRIKREHGQFSLAHLGTREPAEIPGLILCPPRPPPAMGPEGAGGREGGAKVKARPMGPAPLRGGWGRGGVPTDRGTHPRLGVQWGWGRPLVGVRGGTEGNVASTFPVHLGTREPVGLPGLILCPQSLPPAIQNTSPAPTPPPRAPPPNSGAPQSEGPPLQKLPLPFPLQVLSRGPASGLNITPQPT